VEEAYAKGKVDGRLDGMAPSLLEEAYLKGQRSKTAYELGKEDGLKAIMDTCERCRMVQYERGQTDLIEKLMSEYGRGQLCDGCIAAIKLASESLGTDKSIKGVGSYSIKPQPNATVADTGEHSGSNPKPEKPKRKRRNGYAKRL
jgi:hypothetical protein